MKEIDQIKNKIIENARIETIWPAETNGQKVGVRTPTVRVTSDELQLTMELGYSRNRLENERILKAVLGLIVDELIK